MLNDDFNHPLTIPCSAFPITNSSFPHSLLANPHLPLIFKIVTFAYVEYREYGI